MVFKLVQSAEKHWRRIKGFFLIGKVISDIVFTDGVQALDQSSRKAS